MTQEQNQRSPAIATDPEAELASMIERSVELTAEGLEVAKRIRELHEQVAQRHQVQAADDEGSEKP